ncbi:MAG: FmdB family zinc ribbon protein [Dehalococcoidia bacterium]
MSCNCIQWQNPWATRGSSVPLYDYRCEPCDLTFEAARSFADSDVPAHCPMCDAIAARQLSVPMTTFTRGAAAGSSRANWSASSAKWSHHGHSHGPGAASHSH